MGDVGKELVDKLQSNTRLFRERMVEAGFTIKVITLQLHHCDVILSTCDMTGGGAPDLSGDATRCKTGHRVC